MISKFIILFSILYTLAQTAPVQQKFTICNSSAYPEMARRQNLPNGESTEVLGGVLRILWDTLKQRSCEMKSYYIHYLVRIWILSNLHIESNLHIDIFVKWNCNKVLQWLNRFKK